MQLFLQKAPRVHSLCGCMEVSPLKRLVVRKCKQGKFIVYPLQPAHILGQMVDGKSLHFPFFFAFFFFCIIHLEGDDENYEAGGGGKEQ